MNQHTHDICGSVGTYRTQQGEERKRWVKCGAAFTDTETGRLSLKLDAVPVDPAWSGWLSLFEVKDKEPGEPTPF